MGVKFFDVYKKCAHEIVSDTISAMTIIQSIILGAVQGITEFLPISSSGHLILARHVFGIPSTFEFDVLLNIGTLVALLIFFRARIIKILNDIFKKKNYKYAIYVLTATIPTLIVGFIGNDLFKKLDNYTWLIVFMLVLIGALMVIYGKEKSKREITQKDSYFIGAAQVAALIPGTSRSGITILTALIRGVGIREAAEFSFMLAIPTISGALVHTLLGADAISYAKDNLGIIIFGNVASFAFGVLAVKTLMQLMANRGLRPFGWYRIGLGSLLTVLLLVKVI